MKISSKSIKKKALELGFQKVGIARAEPTSKQKDNLESWLDQKRHATMEWMEKRKDERGNIHKYFPDAKSIISVGINYHVGKGQNDIKSDFQFSSYAWGDAYHQVRKIRLLQLLKWIKESKPTIKGIACVDTSPVMDKVWAQKAGIGWIGKHTNLISRVQGSWLFLGELLLDMELEYDTPFVEDLCGSCTACIDAGPTHGLDEYQINAGKCISYLTIEHRGSFPEDHNDLNSWIYGCDICQEVCPWNQKFSQITNEKKLYPKKEILSWQDRDWENISEREFRKLFKGSAVKRTKHKGLVRNIKKINE